MIVSLALSGLVISSIAHPAAFALGAAGEAVGSGSPAPQPAGPSSPAADRDAPRSSPTKGQGESFGPFFVGEPVSETAFSSGGRGPRPVLSVAEGRFCFVDGSWCRMSLLLTTDVGIGLRLLGENGPDLPFSQFTAGGGWVIRPFMWSADPWHPWGIGVVANWSRGTGGIRLLDDDDVVADDRERTDSWRVALVNQLWFSRRRNSLHGDFTIGVVRSEVLGYEQVHWLFGTHAELALGFGGWGSLCASADFLDHDARILFGIRMHGIFGGPIVGAVVGGLAAGGRL